MLSSILKDHNDKQNQRKQDIEKKKYLATQTTNEFAEAILNHLNDKVSNAYINQKKIDNQVKQLNQSTSTFFKQTQQWSQLIENFNTALKELGDVENWSQKIETDMKIVDTTLDYCLDSNYFKYS